MVDSSAEQEEGVKVTLIDYGLVKTCPSADPAASDSRLQMYRWLGWEALWLLSSEAFELEAAAGRENPWEQLPEGFMPFFKRSDLRPTAYSTDKLSPELIEQAMRDAYFDQVLSPAFRHQWADPKLAKEKLGKLIGDLFYGVAQASDRLEFEPNFQAIREEIRDLKALAQH